ncbi:MAG: hypothetical protein MZV65_16335 [Chromatiales bacterium]|nr:hypothetical protein [Chromatiales bacterium]
MLQGRRPKDFDIVTDAQPPRIRKIFRNSRVIGRRFRLVHVYAGRKIFEVSTYQVHRRRHHREHLRYHRGRRPPKGLHHERPVLRSRWTTSWWTTWAGTRTWKPGSSSRSFPSQTIFKEDPVRMIRAAKYAAITGFRIPFRTGWAIRSHADLLSSASPSRLTEEAIKILGSGSSRGDLPPPGSLPPPAPASCPPWRSAWPSSTARKDAFFSALAELDRHIEAKADKALAGLLAFVLRDEVADLCAAIPSSEPSEVFRMAVQASTGPLAPLSMPRIELETAVASVFIRPEALPKPPRKQRRRRSRGRRSTGRTERIPGSLRTPSHRGPRRAIPFSGGLDSRKSLRRR